MISLEANGYTRDAVIKQLHLVSGSREVSFRYELLSKDGGYIGDLSKVEASVSFNSLAEIKRTAKFSIFRSISDDIDFMNERIKPYFKLKMPDGGYAEYPLGVFLISSPTKQAFNNNSVLRNIEAYDKCQILKEDKFLNRYYIASGTNYIEAIKDILFSAGIGTINIVNSSAILSTDIEFEIGTSKLQAINDLLSAINYYSLYFDAVGYAVSAPYLDLSLRSIEYEYVTNEKSIIKAGAQEKIDNFNVPNIFIRVLSTPERPVLKSQFTNDKQGNPLSTVSRGRNIVDYDTIKDIADQVTLDAYVKRIASNASQIFGEITFKTAIMPHHSFMDCLYINHSGLNVSNVYIEQNWNMDLRQGGEMYHTVRRVVKL